MIKSNHADASACMTGNGATSNAYVEVHVPVTVAVYSYPEQGLFWICVLREYWLTKAAQLQ